MKEYKEIIDKIGRKKIYYLLDKDGVQWYPFRYLLEKILYIYQEPQSYKNSLLSSYMKIIYWQNPLSKTPAKSTWFINYSGLLYFLKNLTVGKCKSELMEASKERGLQEARRYLGIKIDSNYQKKYKNKIYDPKIYLGYPRICMDNDPDIYKIRGWKKCHLCNNYLPYNDKYFGKNPKGICHMCEGHEYLIDFKNNEYFFKRRETPIPNYFIRNNYAQIIKIMLSNKEKTIFEKDWTASELIDLILSISEDDILNISIYNLETLFDVLNISQNKFTEAQKKRMENSFNKKTIFHKEFCEILEEQKIHIIDQNIFQKHIKDKIICAFIINNKLCFVSKKDEKIDKYKTFIYNKDREATLNMIKTI